MAYMSDSSGTDDDFPPNHQNRFSRGGRVAGNGRSSVPRPPAFTRMQPDMETQIHGIEQEAYCSVLRAFKAQSDAITWEKESLITELRKELRVSDEEHRELLTRVDADEMILRIREWRKSNGLQHGMIGAPLPLQDNAPSPTISASRKKSKPSQSGASLSVGAPSPAVHQSVQPSSSALKRGPPPSSRGKKSKTSLQQYPTGIPGRPRAPNRSMPGAYVAREPADARNSNPLIGRKLWTRWPDDNHFYEATVFDYSPIKGHLLVYDKGTQNEAHEWVNLNEISPEDIRWEGEDPGIPNRCGRTGSGRGFKKTGPRAGPVVGAGRGRGTPKAQPKKDAFLSQNGIGRKASGDIELLHTDTLIKEVERIFGVSPPDPAEVEKAKRVLKEHEQALVDAIARLEDASDGESDGGVRMFSQGQPMDQEQGRQKRQHDEMGGEGRGNEIQAGNRLTSDIRVVAEKRQDAE
ncbi:EMSY-LIKE 3-like protein [Drosera capensis]